MLNKKPRDRITLPQIKKHPFFEGINWQMLERKLITPPVFLTLEDEDSAENGLHGADAEEKEFLNQLDGE